MWFRVDDKLPWHPKARRIRRSHPSKRRDASPFGLWVLAGAFSDDGFVALDVLEEWDDDAEAQAGRLVAAGLWEPAERAGEPGYVFHDWAALNPADASQSGVFGNHMRWHVGANKPKAGCPLCESEGLVPISGASRPDDRPDIAPMIGGESLPDPIRPDPTRVKNASPDGDGTTPTRYPDAFEEWWQNYPSKTGKAAALTAWRKASKKATASALAEGLERYKLTRTVREGVIKNAATWLNQECWLDETPGSLPLRAAGGWMNR